MKNLIILFSFLVSASASAYVEEQVHFTTADGVVLTGYVARPDAVGTYPALVMQMGSGPGTTDNPNRDYNPFAKMARELADQGFVVLRFDKRGTGYNSSNGSFADGTFSDYVNDLMSAVRSIQSRRDVIREKVYLFGHSLGGPVISIVAKDFPEIKGIILSASPGRSFAEFNLEQTRYLLEWGEGITGEALEKELVSVRRSGQLIDQPEAFCREFPTDCEIKNGRTYMWGQSAQFWREIAALDPLAPLKELKCSVFAIHGTSDWIVSSENDGGAINAVLRNNPKYSFANIDGLDHFLLKADSKRTSVELFHSGMKNAKLEIHPDYIPAISAVLKKWNSADY
jgi:pimeloyl-ACP methyl ester carboxylesterase